MESLVSANVNPGIKPYLDSVGAGELKVDLELIERWRNALHGPDMPPSIPLRVGIEPSYELLEGKPFGFAKREADEDGTVREVNITIPLFGLASTKRTWRKPFREKTVNYDSHKVNQAVMHELVHARDFCDPEIYSLWQRYNDAERAKRDNFRKKVLGRTACVAVAANAMTSAVFESIAVDQRYMSVVAIGSICAASVALGWAGTKLDKMRQQAYVYDPLEWRAYGVTAEIVRHLAVLPNFIRLKRQKNQ